MAKQLHKRFSTEEVKMLLQKYLEDKNKLPYILRILKIKRRRFFELLKEYRKDPDGFSIEYKRKKPTRKIPTEVEKNIIKASYILVKYLQVEWMNKFLKYLLTQNSYLTDRSVIFQSIFSMNKRWYIFITLRWVSSPLYAPCLIWRKYVVFGSIPIHNFLHPGLGSGEGSNALTRAYHLIR
ncbi:MAG: hypothetical protein J7J16_03600 [Deltaproteobacteria bacterium]|nr:hypothetical protein [Deltaproteobacteria bacterium]